MSGGDGGAQRAAHHRVGLVVIHGVGETEPGYAVNTLLETLCGQVRGYKISPYSAFQRLRQDASDEASATFPVVSRRATHEGGAELTAVELHWADLTNLQPGRFNALAGLFRVIFESHHLVDAMLRRSGELLSNIVRALLWLASWMMRGPIAALTIATSAICIFLLFGPVPQIPGDESWLNVFLGDGRRRFVLVETVLLAFAIGSTIGIAVKKDISWYDTTFWLALVTAGLLYLNHTDQLGTWLKKVPPLVSGTHADEASRAQSIAKQLECSDRYETAACYIEGLYRAIIWGWRGYGAILFTAVILLAMRALWTRGQADPARGPISTSIGIVILQFMMWTLIIVSALYTMLNRAELNRDLAPYRSEINGILVEHGVPDRSAAFKLFQFADIPFDWIDRFKFVYGITALTILICIALTYLLVKKRQRIAERGKVDLEATSRTISRVLFNPALVATLIALFLILILMIVYQSDFERYPAFRSFRESFLPFAALVALVSPFLIGHRIRNVVHIARDLIDHHYVPRIESATYFFPWAFRTRFSRPRRSLIEQRLLTLLEQRIMSEKFDVVIFAAHSQGSVVAFDYMRDHMAGQGALGGARAQFMSFGSPLGHVYQKYFFEYAPDGPAWLDVAERVEHWINLHRVDDPIGGYIQVPEGADIENVVMPMGGHMGYWTEPALANALHQLIVRSRFPMPLSGPPPPPRIMPPLF